jgi:hypothetical protein
MCEVNKNGNEKEKTKDGDDGEKEVNPCCTLAELKPGL